MDSKESDKAEDASVTTNAANVCYCCSGGWVVLLCKCSCHAARITAEEPGKGEG